MEFRWFHHIELVKAVYYKLYTMLLLIDFENLIYISLIYSSKEERIFILIVLSKLIFRFLDRKKNANK